MYTYVSMLQALFRAGDPGGGAAEAPFVAAIVGPYDPSLPDEVKQICWSSHKPTQIGGFAFTLHTFDQETLTVVSDIICFISFGISYFLMLGNRVSRAEHVFLSSLSKSASGYGASQACHVSWPDCDVSRLCAMSARYCVLFPPPFLHPGILSCCARGRGRGFLVVHHRPGLIAPCVGFPAATGMPVTSL